MQRFFSHAKAFFLALSAACSLQANAYPFTTDNLTKSQFTYQLQPLPDRYTFNLDYATTGVGCTCIYVLDEYRVKPEAYDRVITITPKK